MGRFIIKRLLMIIPIMIGVTLLLFFLLSLAPGDSARIALGSQATEEQIQMFRDQNGLNAPMVVQYFRYIAGVAQGDLGTSYTKRQPVGVLISSAVGNTLFLSFVSMGLTIILALFLGIFMAIKQNSFFDNFMRVVTIIFTSMPQFWLALMMILLFTVRLGLLPSVGLLQTPGDWIMPIICLACGGITMCARTGRSSMLEVINQDYIRTARAKGLRYNYIIRKHALKNSLLPMVSVYGRIIASCFSGSVVLESVFGINGIGKIMTDALRQKDIPTIMGSIIISAIVITLVNLATDLVYAFIDPRIKSKFIRRKSKPEADDMDEETVKTSVITPGAGVQADADGLTQPLQPQSRDDSSIAKGSQAVTQGIEFAHSRPPEISMQDNINAPVDPIDNTVDNNAQELNSHEKSRAAYKKRSLWTDVWKRLRKNKTAVIGMVVFLAILLTCLASFFIYNYNRDIITPNPRIQLQGPSSEHIFGVDEVGRDIFSRLLWGGRTTLLISFGALIVAFIIGLILGTTAAYYGRIADTLIMRFIDIVMSIPPILLMITLATIIKPSTTSLIFVVGLGLVPNQARLIRGQVLQVSDNEYVEAARIQGASDRKIIISHILPNALSPIITTIILDVAYAVMTICTLSFLGLGVQAPNPEWGAMLAGGRQYIRYAWHITTIPGIALVITIMSLTLVGDGMRDALDPRMKR